MQVDQQTIVSVAFSPDGHWLAAGGEGGLTLWKLDSRGRAHAVPLDGSRLRRINAVAFAQGSRPLLAATTTTGLHIWDLEHRQRAVRRIKGAAGKAPDGKAATTDGSSPVASLGIGSLRGM